MHNWSVDVKKLRKNKEKYAIWKLEQMVNFGLNGEKIDKKLLKKYWFQLNIDPARRKFLDLILYGKKYSDKNSTAFFGKRVKRRLS